MIIATFNVENLFERPRAMNLPSWREGQPALTAAGELNALFNKRVYSDRDKRRMLHLLGKYGLLGARSNNEFLQLRKIRGALLERKAGQKPRLVANGRDSWTGWVELKREQIADEAIVNTARVIAAVNPDILVLVEVESRPALQHFHDKVLSPLIAKPYAHNMVIEGNDERGIDVGILSRYPIVRMRSHIDERTGTARTFSRDCPEYYIELPAAASCSSSPITSRAKAATPPANAANSNPLPSPASTRLCASASLSRWSLATSTTIPLAAASTLF